MDGGGFWSKKDTDGLSKPKTKTKAKTPPKGSVVEDDTMKAIVAILHEIGGIERDRWHFLASNFDTDGLEDWGRLTINLLRTGKSAPVDPFKTIDTYAHGPVKHAYKRIHFITDLQGQIVKNIAIEDVVNSTTVRWPSRNDDGSPTDNDPTYQYQFTSMSKSLLKMVSKHLDPQDVECLASRSWNISFVDHLEVPFYTDNLYREAVHRNVRRFRETERTLRARGGHPLKRYYKPVFDALVQSIKTGGELIPASSGTSV